MSNLAEKDNPNDLAFSYLTSYVSLQYPKYLYGKHHILMAKHLMWIEQGIIDRLIIAMPPRHGKLCSDFTMLATPDGWKKHGELKI